MKPSSLPEFFSNRKLLLPLFALAVLAQQAGATTVTFNPGSTNLSANASWIGGTAPGSADVSQWVAGSGGVSGTFSAPANWQGIANADTSIITIGATGGPALTLGSSGISSTTTAVMNVYAPVTLSANQSWSFASAGGVISIGENGYNTILDTAGYNLSIAGGGSGTALRGNVTGSGSLTAASGATVIANAMTYTGTTAVLATLYLGNSGFGSGTSGSLNSASVINGTGGPAQLLLNRTDSTTLSNTITGNLALWQVAGGVTTIAGANSYVRWTAIYNGGLSVTTLNSVAGGVATSSLGTPSSSFNGNIHLGQNANSGTLVVTGTGETTDRIINLNGTTGGGTLDQSGTGLLKFTSAFTASGVGIKTLTLQGSTVGTGEIAGAIVDSSGGATSLTKAGTGTWKLSGTNTYTGKTVVRNGTLSFSVGNASATANQQLGANATLDLGVASTSSGTLLYTGAAGTLAKAINALGNGTDTIQNSGTGLLTLTGLLTKNGTVLTLKGGTYGITVSGAGTIAGSNSGSDLIVDGGTTTLATANTYNGPTSIINGATLNANITNALPTTNGRTAVSIDPSGSGTSTLALGASQSILSLTGASTSKVSLGANTLTVGTTGGSTTFAGVISGTLGNLVKDGASTQVFSGNNTYTGTTTVSTGTLLISGDQSAATGNVSVSNTATLGGSGKTGGAVTVQNGGFLAPGNNTTGILKVASLALNSTSTTQFEINGTGAPGTNYDQIVVNAGGALALNGAFTIAFGSSLANSSSINLFSFTAGHSGDFTSLVSTGSYAGTWTPSGAVGSEIFTFNTGPQLLTFSEATGNLTVVPEPATWALLAFSLTTVMVMRRRRD